MRPITWFEAIHQLEQQAHSYVLVTVVSVAGSVPRDHGSKMVVTDAETIDTIGGGHLEHACTTHARLLLANNEQHTELESYPLSSKLGQCCGGAVKVLYEVRVNHCQHLAIFGAGHVAKALIPIVAQLPLQITWIDNRAELLSQPSEWFAQLPSNVTTLVEEYPADEVKRIAANSWLLVLTHNHQLDFDIVEAALKQNQLGTKQFDYVGMIGSQVKAKRFATRLTNKGFNADELTAFVSPVGELSINGKLPIEVAVSISAQLINKLNHKLNPKLNSKLNNTAVTQTALSPLTSTEQV